MKFVDAVEYRQDPTDEDIVQFAGVAVSPVNVIIPDPAIAGSTNDDAIAYVPTPPATVTETLKLFKLKPEITLTTLPRVLNAVPDDVPLFASLPVELFTK